MTPETCSREERLLAALRRGPLASDDAAHLAACPSCALAADAERWMSGAVAAFASDRVPSAGSLLLRAQLRARREAAERSLRPLTIWRRLAGAAGAALALLGVLRGDDFFGALWSAAPNPAELLFAFGVLVLGGLPVWLRLRGEGA